MFEVEFKNYVTLSREEEKFEYRFQGQSIWPVTKNLDWFADSLMHNDISYR
jgi:hypothetical protein